MLCRHSDFLSNPEKVMNLAGNRPVDASGLVRASLLAEPQTALSGRLARQGDRFALAPYLRPTLKLPTVVARKPMPESNLRTTSVLNSESL